MLINFGINKQNDYQSLGVSSMADEWLPVPRCIKHGRRMVTSAWVYQTMGNEWLPVPGCIKYGRRKGEESNSVISS